MWDHNVSKRKSSLCHFSETKRKNKYILHTSALMKRAVHSQVLIMKAEVIIRRVKISEAADPVEF